MTSCRTRKRDSPTLNAGNNTPGLNQMAILRAPGDREGVLGKNKATLYHEEPQEVGDQMKTENAIKQARGKIRAELIRQLKEKQIYREPYKDLVERYMNMWDTTISLEDDIRERGVAVDGPSGIKKNDSVALLVNVSKQMLMTLDKLGLQATGVKSDGGSDI